MASPFDPLARREREHIANCAREQSYRDKIADFVTKRDAAEDFEERVSLANQIGEAERLLVIAEGVSADSAKRLQQAQAEASEKAKAERAAAIAKRQAVSAKRIRALADKFIAPLVAELEWLEAETEAFDAYNTTRSQHSYIDDPEKAVRQTRGRTIEAVFEDRVFWRDCHGNQPTILIADRETGEMRPQEAGYSRRVERVCVQPERVIPPTMPDRLADLLPALRKALAE